MRRQRRRHRAPQHMPRPVWTFTYRRARRCGVPQARQSTVATAVPGGVPGRVALATPSQGAGSQVGRPPRELAERGGRGAFAGCGTARHGCGRSQAAAGQSIGAGTAKRDPAAEGVFQDVAPLRGPPQAPPRVGPRSDPPPRTADPAAFRRARRARYARLRHRGTPAALGRSHRHEAHRMRRHDAPRRLTAGTISPVAGRSVTADGCSRHYAAPRMDRDVVHHAEHVGPAGAHRIHPGVGASTSAGTASVSRTAAVRATCRKVGIVACVVASAACGGGDADGATSRFAEYDGVLAGPEIETARCANHAGDTLLLGVTDGAAAYHLWNPESDAPCVQRLMDVRAGIAGAWVRAGTRVRVVRSTKLDYPRGKSITVATVRLLEPVPNVPPMFAVPEDHVRRQ